MEETPEFLYTSAPLPALHLTSSPFFRPVSYIQDGCVMLYPTPAVAAGATQGDKKVEWVVLQLRTEGLEHLKHNGKSWTLSDGRIPAGAVVEPLQATRWTDDGECTLVH